MTGSSYKDGKSICLRKRVSADNTSFHDLFEAGDLKELKKYKSKVLLCGSRLKSSRTAALSCLEIKPKDKSMPAQAEM